MRLRSSRAFRKYTVYSKETTEAMARACADAYKADIGIGVTGTMGNIDPANRGAFLVDRYAAEVAGRLQEMGATLSKEKTSPLGKLLKKFKGK